MWYVVLVVGCSHLDCTVQVLFNDTLWYNIAYGHPDATDEMVRHLCTVWLLSACGQVHQAARAAQLEETVAYLENGFDTMASTL